MQTKNTAPLPQDDGGEEKKNPLKKLLVRIGTALLVVIAVAAAYLFLLLGEPEEDAKYAADARQETITMPMSPFEAPGESNVRHLADTFGQPVLSVYQGLAMQKARIYDTAFSGGYARRVTLTYAFDDGALVTVESIRPTSAVTLLGQDGYSLDATSLYTLGGMDGARMDNDAQICVFTQTESAVYAVICPQNHEKDLGDILRFTMLISPEDE